MGNQRQKASFTYSMSRAATPRNVCQEFSDKQKLQEPSFDLSQENQRGFLLIQDRQAWLKATILGLRERTREIPTKSRSSATSEGGAECPGGYNLDSGQHHFNGERKSNPPSSRASLNQ